MPGETLMYGHGPDCTYYNNGVERCLGCDNIIEIDWMCPHGVHRPEVINGCGCNSKNNDKPGKHRKK